MAVMICGMIRGEIRNAPRIDFPRKRPLTSPIAAKVPSIVEMADVIRPIAMVFHSALDHSRVAFPPGRSTEPKKISLKYCRENPGGGKVRYRLELNAMGITIRTGIIRYASTNAVNAAFAIHETLFSRCFMTIGISYREVEQTG